MTIETKNARNLRNDLAYLEACELRTKKINGRRYWYGRITVDALTIRTRQSDGYGRISKNDAAAILAERGITVEQFLAYLAKELEIVEISEVDAAEYAITAEAQDSAVESEIELANATKETNEIDAVIAEAQAKFDEAVADSKVDDFSTFKINGETLHFRDGKLTRIHAPAIDAEISFSNGHKNFRYRGIIQSKTEFFKRLDELADLKAQIAAVEEFKRTHGAFTIMGNADLCAPFIAKIHVVIKSGEQSREKNFAGDFLNFEGAKKFVDDFKAFAGEMKFTAVIKRDNLFGEECYRRDLNCNEVTNMPDTDAQDFNSKLIDAIDDCIVKPDAEEYAIIAEICNSDRADQALPKAVRDMWLRELEAEETTLDAQIKISNAELDTTFAEWEAANDAVIRAIRLCEPESVKAQLEADEAAKNAVWTAVAEKQTKLIDRREDIIRHIANLVCAEIDYESEMTIDEPDTENDFDTQLADALKAKNAARAVYDEKDAIYRKALDESRKAWDVYEIAKAKVLKLYESKAAELTAKIRELPEFRMTIIKQDGTDGELSNDMTVRFYEGYDFDKHVDTYQFAISAWDDPLIYYHQGYYDTPAQVETVINELRAAIESGDNEFKFPTVDELKGGDTSGQIRYRYAV